MANGSSTFWGGPPGPPGWGDDPAAGRLDGADRRVRLSEIVGALSFALDLTEGQPNGHAARACLIGMRVARELRLGADDCSDLYYALLLKDTGCSSNSAATADFFGSDDQPVKRALKTVDWTKPIASAWYGIRNTATGRGIRARAAQLFTIAAGRRGSPSDLFRIRCERGADIVRKMGFPEATAAAVRALDEHWDGGGEPDGIRGEDIPLLSRIAQLAQTVEVFASDSGWGEAVAVARSRSGRWFDPELVRILCSMAGAEWWASIQGDGILDHLPVVEPDERVRLVDGEDVDRMAEGFAEVVDAKSPFTFQHSSRVAAIAREIGATLGLGPSARRNLYLAGLLHDIGKLGVSNRILDKAGPLTEEEWAAVRAHPIHTWSILSQVGLFRPIARTAAVHHERLDGEGYPWGFDESGLGPSDRILAVADIYDALTSDRPYRSGWTPEDVLRALHEMEGQAVDAEVVEALEASTIPASTLPA